MKKKKLLSCLLAGSLCLALLLPGTAYADGQKVVTLGADLTEDQKTAVLKYFGVLGQNIETLFITNQDERDHLGSYVPLEQIGTKTFSCALVCPTNSGGIQVKTANLSWVTSNMIASTLSTSGVVNCDVLAASPFEVSGTGALTGIIMAYETASGTTLDPVKKDLATQELITTGTIANEVGQEQATSIVNEIKIQVIQNQVQEPEEVEAIVEDVVEENPQVELSDEDRALLTGLMTQIAEQQYNYDEMADTLQRVEENVNNISNQIDEMQNTEASSDDTTPETLADDSILMNTDDSALGEGVTIDATNEEAVPQETQPTEQTQGGEFDITTSDSYSDAGSTDSVPEQNPGDVDLNTQEYTGEAAAPVDEYTAEPAPADENTEISGEPQIPELVLTSAKVSPDCSDGSTVTAGTGQIVLSYGNENLVPVSGELTVTDSFGNVCCNISLSDTEQVAVKPVSDENLLMNGWSAGTDIIVNTGYNLQPSQNYTVSVNGVVAQTADPAVLDGVPTAAVSVSVPVATDSYGVSLTVQEGSDVYAGAVVAGTVILDETMTYAQISSFDSDLISVDNTDLYPDAAGFNVTCLQSGTAGLTVDYYDADGNYLGSAECELNIR